MIHGKRSYQKYKNNNLFTVTCVTALFQSVRQQKLNRMNKHSWKIIITLIYFLEFHFSGCLPNNHDIFPQKLSLYESFVKTINDNYLDSHGNRIKLDTTGHPDFPILIDSINENVKLVISDPNEKVYHDSIIYFYVDTLKIGYIRLKDFIDKQYDLAVGVDYLIEKKPRAIIIDIRENIGGSFGDILGSAKWFLKQYSIVSIVFTNEYPYGDTIIANKEARYDLMECNLILLINQNTCQGAELFSETLRENAGAILIGEQTAGIDKIEKIFFIDDWYYLRLSVGFMRPPSGRSFYRKGITPNYIIMNQKGQSAIHCPSNSTQFIQMVIDGSDKYITKALEIVK